MAIPVSALFTVFDWNSRYASTPDAGDLSIIDTTGGLLVAPVYANGFYNQALGLEGRADSTGMLVVAPVMATLSYPIGVPNDNTFEFDISLPADIPADFSDKDNRIFVGACATNGRTAGFMFSSKGIALAPSPYSDEDDIKYLSGSQDGLITGGVTNDLTIRCITDSDTGRASVYITRTAVAYESDSVYGSHSFGYTTLLPLSTLGQDQLLLAIRSRSVSAGNYVVRLGSARMGQGSVATPDSPVAVIEYSPPVHVGRRLKLDGRGSYDPESLALTYHWELEEFPLGAGTDLRGGLYSTAIAGTAAANNEIAFSSTRASDKSNGTKVSMSAGSTAASLSMRIQGANVYITLATNSVGAVLSKASDVVNAVISPSASAYSSDVAALITAVVPSTSTGVGLVVSEVVTLTGGAGSVEGLSSLNLTKTGIYRLSLRVSNGQRTSPPEIITVQSIRDSQLLGHRPNADYLFMGLSDFWGLVEDKATISVAWSAASQIIGGELMKLLQNDYGKALKDISKTYQRRWLSYRMRIPVPSEARVAPKVAGGAHYFLSPTADFVQPGSAAVSFSTTVGRATIVDPDTLAPGVIAHDIDPKVPIIIVDASGYTSKTFATTVSAASPFTVQTTTKSINALKILASGERGKGVQDPSAPTATTTEYFEPLVVRLPVSQIVVGDLLIIDLDGTMVSRTITSVTTTDPVLGVPMLNVLTFNPAEGKIPADGTPHKWQIVRPVPYCQLFQYPYFDMGPDIDLRPLGFSAGDAVEVMYRLSGSSDELTATIPILHTTTNEIFVDWRSFFQDLAGIYPLVSPDISGVPTIANPGMLLAGMSIVAIIRTESIPVTQDLISIPQLGKSSVYADLKENLDYTVGSGVIDFTPVFAGTAGYSQGISTVTFGSALPAGDVTTLHVLSGEIGSYSVVQVADDRRSVEVSHLFSSSATADVRIPRYGFNGHVPSTFWAELSYFDNWKTIENNFGLVAGIPRSLLTDAGVDLDYKAIVQALWFAFMSGPQIANIKLASEAFMGIPYCDVDGQITVINNDHSSSSGRIVVKQPGRAGYHTYYYPSAYAITNNPATGRPYRAATLSFANDYRLTKSEQAELTRLIARADTKPGDRAEYTRLLQNAQQVDDSTITAFSAFVDAVSVFDYVSEPRKIAKILKGSDVLTRAHTFVIQVPSAGMSGLGFLPILKDFVNEWKPAHTSFLFYGGYAIQEDIVVNETFRPSVRLRLADSAYTSPFVKAPGDNSLSWPDDTVLDNNPDTVTWTYDDAVEKYESSYVSGVMDDYSGDGSWNTLHGILDPVNSADSDVDVIHSFMWVPILKNTTTREFVLGENVSLTDSIGTPLTGFGWDSSLPLPGTPPVIVHIGSGNHPMIPFGVHSPQFDHPNTFLLLGFYRADGADNSGSSNRLRALQNWPTLSGIRIVGATSGGDAELLEVRGTLADPNSSLPDFDKARDVTDPDHAIHKKYFILEDLYQADKLLFTGPRTNTVHQVTQYVPLGGLPRGGGAPELDNAAFVVDDLQQQCFPYDPAVPINEQRVPSYNPGYFSNWADKIAAANVVWGWGVFGTGGGDPGELSSINPHTLFDSDVTHADLENLHIGRRTRHIKGWHPTHGFEEFFIPAPSIRKATTPGGPLDWRVEGYFFVAVDPTMVATPTATPSSFDGTIGGTWVFFRNQQTLVETPADIVSFEAGFNPLQTVLGIPGVAQTSSGHVLNVHVAALPANGWYDIIVRNYRPYVLVPAGATNYHMDEDSIDGVLFFNPAAGAAPGAGFGGGAFGGLPFGA